MSVRDVMYDFGRWLQKKSYPTPKIEFYSPVEGIEDWAAPIPASKAIPQWYRDLDKTYAPNSLPSANGENFKILPTGNPVEWRTTGETVKTCPGMQDILTIGYTLPLWGSILLETSMDGMSAASITSSTQSAYNDGSDADFVKVKTDDAVGTEFMRYLHGKGFTEEEVLKWKKFQQGPLSDNWTVDTHPRHQYETMIKEIPDEWCKAAIKVVSPWRIKTPPGFSTLVMGCPYTFNPVFEVLPGIINTDYYVTFNLFLLMKHRGAKYNIQFGEHMCRWIPFPRYQLPYEVRSSTPDDVAHENKATNVLNTSWGSGKQYRKLGKILDKKTGGKCPYS